jgi:hypothetical protein
MNGPGAWDPANALRVQLLSAVSPWGLLWGPQVKIGVF